MTNEEAIKSMRNLDDVISITESEHESVKTAISALKHNSLLIEHISNFQNENTDFFNKLVKSEQENTKLKAEIKQLKKQRETRIKVSEANFNIYSKLEIERDNLVAEIEQLKSELEQSVKLPCKVGDVVYLLDFEENKFDEATVEEIVITKNGKIEINSDYEIGTWSEDTYIKYSLKEAEQTLKGQV